MGYELIIILYVNDATGKDKRSTVYYLNYYIIELD